MTMTYIVSKLNSYNFPGCSHSGEAILSTAYGLEIASKTDKYIALAKAAVDPCVPALIPGTFLVDVIPALKYVPEWLPGASFRRMAKKWRGLALALRDIPYENAKHEIVRCLMMLQPRFILKFCVEERKCEAVFLHV